MLPSLSNALVTRYLIYSAMAATAVRLMRKSDFVQVHGDEEQEVESHGRTEENDRSDGDHAQWLLPQVGALRSAFGEIF